MVQASTYEVVSGPEYDDPYHCGGCVADQTYGWDPAAGGFAGVPATSRTIHQRTKQYIGDHVATNGEVKLRIDSNLLDTPVASSHRSTGRTRARTSRGPRAT